MLTWIFQITILSILFIFLIEHLIVFFKDNLTVPKLKDLVNKPSQKYEDIYHIISSKKDEDFIYNKYSKEDLLPKDEDLKPDVNSMKNELKTFLKQQFNLGKNTNLSSTTDISSLDVFNQNSSSIHSSY
jgi:hypothetical protein